MKMFNNLHTSKSYMGLKLLKVNVVYPIYHYHYHQAGTQTFSKRLYNVYDCI